jgi:hypothetical protein
MIAIKLTSIPHSIRFAPLSSRPKNTTAATGSDRCC